jgi:hypothetical protein
VSAKYRDPTYLRVLGATKRSRPIKRARVNVVREAAKLLLDDGWLALTLFATLLLSLIFQR